MGIVVSSSSALDIRRFIDDRPVSRYQLLVAVMCGLIVFVDGFDAQAMGFVARAVFKLLATYISAGEIQDIQQGLPKELNALWPTHSRQGERAL